MVTEWSDPTVYVPYVVEVEQDEGNVQAHPVHFVTMTPGFVFVRDLAGGSVNLPIRSVRSIRVAVHAVPADYDVLRAQYPDAYQPWRPGEESGLRNLHELRGTLVYDRLRRRPPAHLLAKARQLGFDPTVILNEIEDEPKTKPDSLDASISRSATETGDYLVIVKGDHDPYHILSRHHISPDNVYRIASWGFGVTLTGPQLGFLAEAGESMFPKDPDIARIEHDPDRLAPHFLTPEQDRADGSYLVDIRCGRDPLTVAARAGVSPSSVFNSLNMFAADMTDAQVQALRRDPDVISVEDDRVATLE